MKKAYVGLALYVLSMACFAFYVWFIWPPAAIVMLACTGVLALFFLVSIWGAQNARRLSQAYEVMVRMVEETRRGDEA